MATPVLLAVTSVLILAGSTEPSSAGTYCSLIFLARQSIVLEEGPLEFQTLMTEVVSGGAGLGCVNGLSASLDGLGIIRLRQANVATYVHTGTVFVVK